MCLYHQGLAQHLIYSGVLGSSRETENISLNKRGERQKEGRERERERKRKRGERKGEREKGRGKMILRNWFK